MANCAAATTEGSSPKQKSRPSSIASSLSSVSNDPSCVTNLYKHSENKLVMGRPCREGMCYRHFYLSLEQKAQDSPVCLAASRAYYWLLIPLSVSIVPKSWAGSLEDNLIRTELPGAYIQITLELVTSFKTLSPHKKSRCSFFFFWIFNFGVNNTSLMATAYITHPSGLLFFSFYT